MLIVPITISLSFAPLKRLYKIICRFLSLLGLSALILTLSRRGWIGFLVSIIFLFFLGLRTKLINSRKIVFISVLSMFILLIMTPVFYKVVHTSLYTDDYGAAYSRIPLMKVAINVIKANPIIGVGINNYSRIMHHYDSTRIGISFEFKGSVHNIYLLIAYELGIVELILFLIFVFIIYKKGIKILYCRDSISIISYLALGILVGITGYLVDNMVGWNYIHKQAFLFFITLCGLLVTLYSWKFRND